MARAKTVPQKTLAELRQHTLDTFVNDIDRAQRELQPPPTRRFVVGEEVRLGALKEVFVEEVLWDGMAYLCRCTWSSRDEAPHTQYRCAWWFDIRKLGVNLNTPRLMSTYRRHAAISSSLDSVLFLMNSGGLVCNPKYQREYVWSEANKDALIESIFDRLDIGAFIFVRNHGYLHENDDSAQQYRTIDGRDVCIPRRKDYTTSIIDGQQRLTTIVDFVLDRRPYRGVYYSELHPADRAEFEGASVMYRMLSEDDVTDKEVVRLFLQSNRGVPQTAEHLAKVQALYESMKD